VNEIAAELPAVTIGVVAAIALNSIHIVGGLRAWLVKS